MNISERRDRSDKILIVAPIWGGFSYIYYPNNVIL